MSIRRGWEVTLYDGTIIQEGQLSWNEVPKNQIHTLSLLYEGRRWDLSNKEAYFVSTKASVVPGVTESFRVEERTIGFYDGADKICYTINEFTGKLTLKVL